MPEPTPLYTVKVVDRSGGVFATLANAVVTRVEWELNAPGSAAFTLPTTDPQAVELRGMENKREIQIWYSGLLIFWGPLLRSRGDTATVEFQAAGLLWYFTRSLFGPIILNYLANPQFESGMSDWTATGCSAAVSSDRRALGSQAVKLEAAAADSDAYLAQTIPITTPAAQGIGFTLAGWCFIDSSLTAWSGPALEERGLYLGASSAGDPIWHPLTNSTDQNRWIRMETDVLLVPEGTSDTLDVRLYCGGGVVWWDALSVTVAESVPLVETAGVPMDVSDLLGEIVDYAQNGFPNLGGKSSKNIGFAGSATGVMVDRRYQSYDNGNVYEAMMEFPKAGWCDFDVVWNAGGTTRTFTVYPGRRGQLRPTLTITLGSDLVVGLSYEVDGTQTTTSHRVLGQGDGSDREIGLATDASSLDGMILEAMSSAPSETAIDGLQLLAEQELARAKEPVKTPRVTIRDPAMIGVLTVGDRVPMNIDYGWLYDVSERRIVRMTLDPQTDTLELGLNLDA